MPLTADCVSKHRFDIFSFDDSDHDTNRRAGLWGAKSPSPGFVIDNREPSPSATAGLGGGVGCFTFSSAMVPIHDHLEDHFK
jgi:hypothetical protein